MLVRNMAVIVALLVLWLSPDAGSIVAMPHPTPAPSEHEVVFAVPIGHGGVRYEGEQAEMLPWGPAALAIAPDGSFWIADTVSNRLLRYSPEGVTLSVLDLSGHAVGIGDLEVSSTAIWALDIAATTPVILRISSEGKIVARYELPEYLQREHGLSGIALIDEGDVAVEREGGASLFRLTESSGTIAFTPLEGYTYNRRLYVARFVGTALDDATRGVVISGDVSTEVAVTHHLGGLRILGVRPAGGFYLVVEEVTVDDAGAIRVDQTVRHYDAGGRLQGMARVPLDQQYTYVAHGLAVGPDGAVYALMTHPDRVEVQRLRFTRTLEPILISGSPYRNRREPGDTIIAQGCVSRDSMMNIANAYVNNSKFLSTTNTDGSCPGRGKPRYLGGAGNYSSVAYDWGGWDTVSGYNGYMHPGTYQSGDIDTAGVESCSRGVDCSGFVSRVWQLSSKYSTSTLPNISWELPASSDLRRGDILNKAGSHVILFSDFGSNGIYGYESTTYNAYDRVVYMYSAWSRLSGYSPRRYNSVCP
ncbi:MAG: hypothetical protein J7479_20345 [Roseiflexus sp.]|nr:hypothetical protein [Roseiflexus sp.]